MHIINRSFDEDIELTVDLSEWEIKNNDAEQFILSGNYSNSTPCDLENNHYLCSNYQRIKNEGECNKFKFSKTIN